LASLAAALFLCPLSEWDPRYRSQEQAWFETEGENFLPDGWWKFTEGCIAIPELLAPTFVQQFHEGTHSGQRALETTLAQHCYIPKLSSISKTACKRCRLCAETISDKGQDVTICWYLSALSQGRWKPSPLARESPKSGQVKENHPSILNTFVYWVKQWAGLCGSGGTLNG
jgi:hypothetical protein